jgi:DNA-directed RNA polymerase subunit RPC12/RpoP
MSSYIFKEPSLRYKILTSLVIISFILITIFGGFLLAPVFGYIPFYLAILLLLALLIFFHTKNTAYLCKNCNHEFEISFWQDLMSAHTPGKKLLKCPECSYKDYATELVKTKNKFNN